MKSQSVVKYNIHYKSHPVRGAWIEIGVTKLPVVSFISSHPVRGAWIEIVKNPPARTIDCRRIP